MSHSPRTCVMTLVLCVVLVSVPSVADDKIEFSNIDATKELGFIVDGQRGSTTVNDEVHRLPPGTYGETLANFDGATESEIMGFQAGRMVGIEPAAWTSGDDNIRIELQDEQGVGLVVWFLVPRDSRAFNRVIAASGLAGQIWRDERIGLKLTSLELYDVSDTAGSSFSKFRCTEVGCAEGERLQGEVPPIAGKVNVYYVEEVDFGDGFATTNGVWCEDNVVVLGKESRCDLLSHEFGHTLELAHVSGVTLDERNVMWALSVKRRFYTEGQAFRAHIHPTSAINDTYGLRPSGSTHVCTTALNCPPVELRVWAE